MVSARIAVVGDFDPVNETHALTNAALEHAGAVADWIPTEACEDDLETLLAPFAGVWIAPGSPYRSMEGALRAIRHARERSVPLVGT